MSSEEILNKITVELSEIKEKVNKIDGIENKVNIIEKEVGKIAGIEKEVGKIAGIEKEVGKIAGIEKEVSKISKMEDELLKINDKLDIVTNVNMAQILSEQTRTRKEITEKLDRYISKNDVEHKKFDYRISRLESENGIAII